MIAAGTEILGHVPVLADQVGSPPDLVLRWNDMDAAPAALDLVLHLHGYSPSGAAMDLAAEKLPVSGLDFGDPEEPPDATPSRTRPTLAVMPRGRWFGGRTGCGYDFPMLAQASVCGDVLRIAIDAFAELQRLPAFPRGSRRILTAHSGGGAGAMPVAAGFAPHEIHVFDGLYSENPGLADWAEEAIAADAALLRRLPGPVSAAMARDGHALRVFFIPDTGTDGPSRTLRRRVERALRAAGREGERLRPWYRVEETAIEHGIMPRRLGWRLLVDAADDVSDAG